MSIRPWEHVPVTKNRVSSPYFLVMLGNDMGGPKGLNALPCDFFPMHFWPSRATQLTGAKRTPR